MKPTFHTTQTPPCEVETVKAGMRDTLFHLFGGRA